MSEKEFYQIICPVCGNIMSLNEARKAYAEGREII